MPTDRTRRHFLNQLACTGSAILAARALAPARAQEPKKPGEEEEVSPAEDLMREHGVLKRVMLAYDEIVRRIEAKQDFAPQALSQCAQMIRSFVEDYHEKLEEQHLFPRFRKANKLVDLVDILTAQHQAGRAQTEVILQNASLKSDDQRQKVVRAVRAFNRMYAPHEAREDTVLFPAFRGIVSRNEYDALGEEFEKQENKLFGQEGFEKMVDRIAGIEKTLGIYDLAQFTPKL